MSTTTVSPDKPSTTTDDGKKAVAAPARGEDPKYLSPKMGGVPVSEPAVYRSLYVLETVDAYLGKPDSSADKKELNAPVDPFNNAALGNEAMRKPAVGVLMVHSQAWEQSDLALGNLLQSICLAPGEVTRVAVVDWRRRETGKSEESAQQLDAVTNEQDQQRAVNAVQKSVLDETQSGRSQSAATSASLQGGATISTLFASANVSASANATGALTAQFSAGSKNLEASSNSAISQKTAEKSQSLRSRRQSVVREVSQQESEQMTSRILANYNRRHSLNVEYFEVLQRYEIKTRMLSWERCLFVPLVPLDFNNTEVLKRHQADLIAIVTQLGTGELATRILEAIKGITVAEDKKQAALQAIRAQQAEIAAIVVALHQFFNVWVIPGTRAVVSGAERDKFEVEYANIEKRALAASFKIPSFEDFDGSTLFQTQLRMENTLRAKEMEYQSKLASYTIPVGEVLNTNQIFLSQQIWLRMDSYRIYRVLEPYTINGKSLTSLVDPRPTGVFGSYLAFRWGFGRDAQKERDDFEKRYVREGSAPENPPTFVALPTSGVFAEAVLGRGEAAEEIDERKYGTWAQNQPPILPPDIAALQSRDRAKDVNLNAQQFAAALAQLRATPIGDAPSMADLLGAVTKGDTFRNMGGLEQALALSEKLAAESSAGATRAGDRAAEMQAKMLDTMRETLLGVLNSDVGKAALAEFVFPGGGAAMMGLGGGGNGRRAPMNGPDRVAQFDLDANS